MDAAQTVWLSLNTPVPVLKTDPEKVLDKTSNVSSSFGP